MIPKNIFQTIFLTSFIFIGVKSLVEVQSRHKRKNINIGHVSVLHRQSFNPNEPNYIFLLPENQTVVLRKSDFDHVIYPNVTNVNKFSKSKKKSTIKSKDSHHAASVSKEKFENFYENNGDEQDYESIVKENIQTERNFVNFIEEMNLDLSSEEVKLKSDKVKTSFKDKIETNRKNEWDDLGLEGWEGAITQKRKNNTKNE